MDILKRLNNEEKIGGLEISETDLRFLLLEKKGPNEIPVISVAATIPLGENVINEGKVINPEELAVNLLKLRKIVPKNLKYVITSIPDPVVFSHIFSFPATLSEEKLNESVKLAISFQLPIESKDYYIDWKEIPSHNNNVKKILLTAAQSVVINQYIELLRATSFFPVAIESNAASIGRSIATSTENAAIYIKITPSYTGIFIYENGYTQLNRILPKRFVEEKNIQNEIDKAISFFNAEGGSIVETITENSAHMLHEYSDPEMEGTEGQWLASLGAAIRGNIKRTDDHLPSLMPLSTTTAYEYQKVMRFASLISTLIVGLGLFFSVAFIGSWIYIKNIQEQTQQENIVSEDKTASPPEEKSNTIESNVTALNNYTHVLSQVFTTSPLWSKVLNEIKAKTPAVITISGISINTTDYQLKITGTAGSRTELNSYRKNLSDSPLFTNINLPLNNLEMASNIPFSISFQIKDPTQIFFKPTQ